METCPKREDNAHICMCQPKDRHLAFSRHLDSGTERITNAVMEEHSYTSGLRHAEFIADAVVDIHAHWMDSADIGVLIGRGPRNG